MHFRPLNGGLFLPFPTMLRSGLLRRLDPGLIEDELLAQLAAFKELFGRAPDFVDGHQHAQLFPQVRDAFLRAVKEAAPGAWVRQGGRLKPLAGLLGAPKALVLDVLSAQFRKRAARAGIPFNPAFAGAYDFSKAPDFGVLMGEFLRGIAGRRARDVPPWFRRRNAQGSRPPHHPARGGTRVSGRRSIPGIAGGE